jgi:hypothetical protein
MAHHIRFVRVEDHQTEMLARVDDAICAYLGVEPHPTRYYMGWYDPFAEHFMLGGTPDRLHEIIDTGVPPLTPEDTKINQDAHSIVNFLVCHYRIETWRTWGFA